MGILGIIFVLVTSIMFFKDYEYIVNKIFNAPKRSVWQSLSTYWTLLTLTPIALGISFFVSKYIQNFLNTFDATSWINLIYFLPFIIIWLLLFVVILISSTVKQNPKYVLIISFISSLIWYTSKTIFIYYVNYNKTYMSIYGSFSTLMFFLIWIYFSWIVFVYTIKICAIVQNKFNIEDNEKNT
jgi:membrane protein